MQGDLIAAANEDGFIKEDGDHAGEHFNDGLVEGFIHFSVRLHILYLNLFKAINFSKSCLLIYTKWNETPNVKYSKLEVPHLMAFI